MSYSDWIDKINMYSSEEIDVILSTGDSDYPGTAFEVRHKNHELFHVVIDDEGHRQVVFLSQNEDYRLSLNLLEEIIASAKEKVVNTDILYPTD